jgi:membrane-bound lytic murein transglycosylase D
MRMRSGMLICAALLCVGAARSQEDTFTADDLLYSAEKWAKENLDEKVVEAVQSGDPEKIKKALAELEKQMRGEYVIDLAAWRDAARSLLPLLETYEETAPYANWLRTRLDYFDVAEDARKAAPPPKVTPGKPLVQVPNPTPEKEREVWVRKLADRPWPEKAKSYVTKLKPIFEEQKVPGQLVWLAEVESSFDADAQSPVGAVGMFQLMPATAKRFGLRTWPFDQRYKPEASARAASSYLQVLHKRFKDWRLALAAYNAGEGTVQRLLDQRKARTFDQIAPYLPAETQLYVPKVEATLKRREGVKLNELPAIPEAG